MKDLKLKEYSWNTGVVKTGHCLFAQVNPTVEYLPVAEGHDPNIL